MHRLNHSNATCLISTIFLYILHSLPFFRLASSYEPRLSRSILLFFYLFNFICGLRVGCHSLLVHGISPTRRDFKDVAVLQHLSMVSLKFRHAVQDAHDDVLNMFRVFKQLHCKAAGHGTVLTLTGERDKLEAGTVPQKLTDKRICNPLQNSTQFLKLLW
jgi:hypothetical protein